MFLCSLVDGKKAAHSLIPPPEQRREGENLAGDQNRNVWKLYTRTRKKNRGAAPKKTAPAATA
jgi:hypothetical protein